MRLEFKCKRPYRFDYLIIDTNTKQYTTNRMCLGGILIKYGDYAELKKNLKENGFTEKDN